MTLFLDERSTVARPATHALVLGVSDYEHLPPDGVAGPQRTFDFKKLDSPALSAYRVADWLKRNKSALPRRLATVRLLLCATPAEKAAEPALIGAFDRPTLANAEAAILAWRKDASSHADNVTFFYFAGHGLQRTRDGSVLLLDDFGKDADGPGNPLKRAIDLQDVVSGMAPTTDAPDMARTQFYFVDACRDENAEIARLDNAEVPPMFAVLNVEDDRNRPVFFSTVSGAKAKGRVGRESFFCEALLKGLEAAAERQEDVDGTLVWPITITSLQFALTEAFNSFDIEQRPRLGGVYGIDAHIRHLTEPPLVRAEIALRPQARIQGTAVEIHGDSGTLAGFNPPRADHPYALELRAGVYRIVARTGPPSSSEKFWTVPVNQRQRVVQVLFP